MALSEASLREEVWRERRRGKASRLGAQDGCKKDMGLPAIVLKHNQYRRKEKSPAQPQPVSLWSEAMFPSGFPKCTHLNYPSSMKAWRQGEGSPDTKSSDHFLCLISYNDLKCNSATASSPSQKPRTFPADAFFSLPQDHGP